MAYGESNGHACTMSRDRKVKVMVPTGLGINMLKTAGDTIYLATIANYKIACCKAVRSAILATAWRLVYSCDY